MSNKGQSKFTRRQFAGTLAGALAAPALLGGLGPPAAAQEKKPEAKPEPSAEERRERALKTLREFPVREGAEPAFVFRA